MKWPLTPRRARSTRLQKCFDDLDNLVLLTAWEFLHLLENGADLAAGGGGELTEGVRLSCLL